MATSAYTRSRSDSGSRICLRLLKLTWVGSRHTLIRRTAEPSGRDGFVSQTRTSLRNSKTWLRTQRLSFRSFLGSLEWRRTLSWLLTLHLLRSFASRQTVAFLAKTFQTTMTSERTKASKMLSSAIEWQS